MNVTEYCLSVAQSAIAAYFTAVPSRTRRLFLRNHAPCAVWRSPCGAVPARLARARTGPCREPDRTPWLSSPICLTSSRGRRYFRHLGDGSARIEDEANGLILVLLGEVSACRHAIPSAGNQRQSTTGCLQDRERSIMSRLRCRGLGARRPGRAVPGRRRGTSRCGLGWCARAG